MTDHISRIQTLLDTLSYTPPEQRTTLLHRITVAVDGLLRENGWMPKSVLLDLPEGVTPEEAQAAVDALAGGTQGSSAPDIILLSSRELGDLVRGTECASVEKPSTAKRTTKHGPTRG